jgi:micrococcal nuclease
LTLYTYMATVDRWVDGATVDLVIDLGFRMSTHQRFRLLDVDTPERGEANWKEATACANAAMPPGSQIAIQSLKTDKYGRWLVDLPMVREALVARGLTKPK